MRPRRHAETSNYQARYSHFAHIVSAMAKKRPDNIPQKAAVATGTMPSRSSSKRSVKKKSGGYSKRE
jgi:hypothetical protein